MLDRRGRIKDSWTDRQTDRLKCTDNYKCKELRMSLKQNFSCFVLKCTHQRGYIFTELFQNYICMYIINELKFLTVFYFSVEVSIIYNCYDSCSLVQIQTFLKGSRNMQYDICLYIFEIL